MELLWVNHAGAPRRVDYSWLLVCAAVLIPWSALAGWALDSPLLESTGFSSGNKINPFTGISLLCIAAGWVLLFRAGWPRVARLLALFPLAVSGLRLFESATGKNTTFDFLLFHNRMLNQPHPNHIASNTAIMLLGLALAILLGGKGGWRDELAVWIVIIAGTVPFFAVLGYASQFGLLYGVALQTPMALNGACSGLLLIFPILASLKNTRVLRPFSSLTSGGIMARRLFPLALGIPVVASLLLNTAVNRALVDKVTAIAVLIIAVVILIAVGIHWTASSIDEFDKGRTEQTGIIAEQNRQLTGVVQELRTRSDDLAVAHAALNAVLDAATQVGIVGMDTMGTIRHFNTGAEAILGYKRAEVTGILLAIIRKRIFLDFRRSCRVAGHTAQFEAQVFQVVVGHRMNQQFFDDRAEIGQ